MKNFIYLLLILLIISCDDDENGEDPVPVDGVRTYVDGEVGTYWYYETYALDESSSNSLVSSDSIVVEEISEYDGRMARKCRTYTKESGSSSWVDSGVFYLSTEDDRLLIHSDGFLNLFGGSSNTPLGDPADFLELESEWLIGADKNESRWDVFEADIDFSFGFFDISGESEAKGRRISTSILENIDGDNYWTDEYDINNEGNFEIELNFPVPADIDFEVDYTIRLADGLGIYSIKTISSEIDIPGQEFPEPVDTEQKLIRFELK